MQFKRYSEVLATWDTKELLVAAKDLNWVVQEKVRGAPLSFWVSNGGIEGANRQRFLKIEEDYFNWAFIAIKLTSKLLAIRKRIKAREIVIYGDVFGGYYPHPDLDEYSEPGAIPLKRGVAYSTRNDWYAYDIVIDGMWQPQWYMYQLFDELGVKYAFELFNGKLSKALAYPHVFTSEIPELYGLPRLESNKCAGVIIRPAEPVFLPDGRRALLKREDARWS